jgi:hypothetical protein
VKGTKFEQNTDFDGKYAIKQTPSQILTFSYWDENPINAASSSSVIYNDCIAFELKGVVVTALGNKREKSVDMPLNKLVVKKYLEKSSNFVNSLSGKVAGLDIKSSNFGGSTCQLLEVTVPFGNNQALFVVDGTIDNGNLKQR